jgi:hypothetical protein
VSRQNGAKDASRVILRTVSSRAEADLLSNVLAGAGIEALVASDDCGALDPAFSFVRGVHVFVRASDRERAEALLEESEG